MTNRTIRKFIDRLNNKKGQESIFLCPISKDVDLAKVWDEQPSESNSISRNFSSNTFFFIKNPEGFYVGAVLDMTNDLHWYVIPKFRKQGHLTKALRSAILPYISSIDREYQKIEQGAFSITKK